MKLDPNKATVRLHNAANNVVANIPRYTNNTPTVKKLAKAEPKVLVKYNNDTVFPTFLMFL